MKNQGTFRLTTPSDREILMTRVFDAPRSMVFDALTKPEVLKRWLLGPPGWTMTLCKVDLKVGGSYRYEWRKDNGTVMGMGGVFREIVPPERIVSTETFDESWYPGEALGTVVLTESAGQTTLAQTVLYESREARDEVLKSGMESGVIASYDRLAELFAKRLAATEEARGGKKG